MTESANEVGTAVQSPMKNKTNPAKNSCQRRKIQRRKVNMDRQGCHSKKSLTGASKN